jgi:hypothetical protein
MSKIALAKKIVQRAKAELNEEREKNLKDQAKTLLKDISEARRTVDLLERQLRNFMREVELD